MHYSSLARMWDGVHLSLKKTKENTQATAIIYNEACSTWPLRGVVMFFTHQCSPYHIPCCNSEQHSRSKSILWKDTSAVERITTLDSSSSRINPFQPWNKLGSFRSIAQPNHPHSMTMKIKLGWGTRKAS